MHSEFLVQHSSHTSIGNPKGSGVFPWGAPWRLLDWCPHRLSFSCVLTLRGRPGGFRPNVDPVALTFETHSRIVFRSGTGARRPILNSIRNALCVAITDSLFLKNVSTTKPRCSSDQPTALSENGKTTANQRDPSHHCTPSTARAVTSPNVGVISAAPCRIYYSNVYWRLNMFRAAYRSSSGARNCICSLWCTYTCGDRPLSDLTTAGHHMCM